MPTPDTEGARRTPRLSAPCRSALLAGCLFLAAGCASTNLAPIGAGAGLFASEDDERTLWHQADRIDEILAEAELVSTGGELDAYLQEVLDGLLAGHLSAAGVEPSVRVLWDPTPNAFALPNGSLYLHSGLLARMDDEAQLAVLLAHELVHFTHRHSLKETRRARNRAAVANVMVGFSAAMASGAGSEAAAVLLEASGSAAELWAIASIMGYSRDLEREADRVAFEILGASTYDPRAGLALFAHLKEEADRHPEPGDSRLLASHPHLDERIRSWERLLGRAPRRDAVANHEGSDRYRRAVSQLLPKNAVLAARAGRYAEARAQVARHLSLAPESARGYLALGEIERLSQDDPTGAAALRAHERACALDPDDPDAQKALGLLYRAQGRQEEANAALTAYVRLAPEALDRSLVAAMISDPNSGEDSPGH